MSALKQEIRAAFRFAVLQRSARELGRPRCECCGRSDVPLDAHHIIPREDMPFGGYVASNGIAVCNRGPLGCHWKAERWPTDHPTFGRAALFERINSSEERAREDSEALGKTRQPLAPSSSAKRSSSLR